MLHENHDVTRKLRALWALHVTKGLNESELAGLLDHESEYIRSWAIQLLTEDSNPSDSALMKFAVMAKSDGSAMVRLYLASALQRTPLEKRWDIIGGLYQHGEDSTDQNLPFMCWYALEPLVPTHMNKAIDIAMNTKLPKALAFTIQRIGAIGSTESKTALEGLAKKLNTPANKHRYHQELMLIETALKK